MLQSYGDGMGSFFKEGLKMSAKKSFAILLLIVLVSSISSPAMTATSLEIEEAIEDGVIAGLA